MRNRLLLTACLAFLAPRMAPAQDADAALIVTEFISSNGIAEKEQLVRYQFADGRLLGKEVLLTCDPLNLFGQVRLVRNRYVVSQNGHVIDLLRKKHLLDAKGDVIGIEDSLVIIRKQESPANEILAYNMEDESLTVLPLDSKWYLPGDISPDGKKSLCADFGGGRELRMYQTGREPVSFGEGFIPRMSRWYGDVPSPATMWLDDGTFLAVKEDGSVVTVTAGGRSTTLLTLKMPDELYYPPELSMDEDGQIIYSCGADDFILDIKRKTCTPRRTKKISADFSCESAAGQPLLQTYFHHGKSIGRLWSRNAMALGEYLCAEYTETGGNLGYPAGVRVWHGGTGQWLSLDADWFGSAVGWIAPERDTALNAAILR